MNNCVTRPLTVLSILKFAAKSVPIIFKICVEEQDRAQENETAFKLFVRRLLTVSMVYSMTIDNGPSSSFVHTAFQLEKGRQDFRLNKNVEYVLCQSLELRYFMRGHLQKVFKSIAEENLVFLLSLVRVNVEEADLGLVILTHVHMLDVIHFLVKLKPPQMTDCLDLIVKLVLKSIETTHADIRKKCTEYAKRTLKSILTHFPASAFHVNSQHFIVPNAKYELVVFDLKMALECVVLVLHRKPISAIAIHPAGDHCASFSFEESKAVVWELKYRGFFNSFFARSPNQVFCELNLETALESVRKDFDPKTLEWSLVFESLTEITLVEKARGIKKMIKIKQN